MGKNAKTKKQPAGAQPSAATPKMHANAGDQTAVHPTSPEAEKNEAESEARAIPVMQTLSKPQTPPQTPRENHLTPRRMPSEATAAASEENRAAPSSSADEPASLPSPLPSDTDSETPPGSPGLSSPDEAAAEAVISLYARATLYLRQTDAVNTDKRLGSSKSAVCRVFCSRREKRKNTTLSTFSRI